MKEVKVPKMDVKSDDTVTTRRKFLKTSVVAGAAAGVAAPMLFNIRTAKAAVLAKLIPSDTAPWAGNILLWQSAILDRRLPGALGQISRHLRQRDAPMQQDAFLGCTLFTHMQLFLDIVVNVGQVHGRGFLVTHLTSMHRNFLRADRLSRGTSPLFPFG